MLDRLVSILPTAQQAKAKAWVAWLGTVAGLLTLVIPEAPGWLTAAILVLSALGVYQTPAPGYVRPAPGHAVATFVGQAPATKRTPGGLAIWGIILAGAGIVEVWGITNEGSNDTLSEFTRWIFDTDGSGAIVFGASWVAFAGWYLWHILGGRKKREGITVPADGRVYEFDSMAGTVTPVPYSADAKSQAVWHDPLDGPAEDYQKPI